MKKLAGLMFVIVIFGLLGGCASTCCQQPTPVYTSTCCQQPTPVYASTCCQQSTYAGEG